MRGRRQPTVAFADDAGLLVALSGCSGDSSETEVAAAQVDLSAMERALAEAESAATAAADAFCTASGDHVTALDRYADALADTAPTVGDAPDAGQDLTEPREALQAGEVLASAPDAVAAAEQDEQDLAESQAAMRLETLQEDFGVEPPGTVDDATVAAFQEALATAGQTPTPSPSPETATPSPDAPSEQPAPAGSTSAGA